MNSGPGRLVEGIVEATFRRPGTTILVWIAAASICVIHGLPRLAVDTSTSTFLDRSSPEWTAYRGATSEFGGDEYLAVAIPFRGEWDWELLSRLPKLSQVLAGIEGVRRVDSLSTVPLIRADEADGLLTSSALADGVPGAPEERRRLRRLIERDPLGRRVLISEGKQRIGLAVVLDDEVDGDRKRIVQEVERALEEVGGIVSGVPVFRTAVNERTVGELLTFVPLTLALIGGLALIAFRRMRDVVVLLVPGLVAAPMLLGAMGTWGVPLSLSTLVLPSIVMALGCAYAMHVIVEARSEGSRRSGRVVVGEGILWSSITTCIGFVAIGFTEVEAIWHLGVCGAAGVLLVGAAALTLPSAVLRLGKGGEAGEALAVTRLQDIGVRWTRALAGRGGWLFVGWALSAVLLASGLSRLQIESNIIRWFSEADPVRASYESIRDGFSGITPVSVVLESEENQSVLVPDVVEAIDSLAAHLEAGETVGRVFHIATPLRLMREGLGREGLPRTLSEAEQYLVLLEGKDQIRDVLAEDHRSAQLLLRLDVNESVEILELRDSVSEWWRKTGPDGYSVRVTGLMYEFARAQEAIARTQIRGLSVALIAIGCVLMVALGSVRDGVLAAVLNSIPILMGFGAMGLAGVSLDAATVCIGNLALGIAVDDTVHVMLRARRSGRPHKIAGYLPGVFPALTLTTACVVAGFLALGLSDFEMIRHLGLVTAGVVAVCWLADVTLLPAIMARRGPKGVRGEVGKGGVG